MRLLVVAGHGKKSSGVMDNGASGNGYNEAERVRTLANRMKALGESSVILGDQSKKWLDYGLYNTVNKSTFDCAIELHMDSASANAKGGHVIIKSGLSADNYDKALESFIKGYFPGRSNTLVGRNDLGVVNACAKRSINFRLLEVCFISNADDISKFNSNVDAVAKSILAAFGIGTSGSTASGSSSGGTTSGGATTTKKSNDTIANEVIAGKWGTGNDRKNKLSAAGYDYSTIQALVNKKLGVSGGTTSSSASNKKSNDTIAAEVVAGKWGNGTDRKAKLEAAGYNYSTIQALVNQKLTGKSSAPASNKKSNDTIANEVIAGKWGNGNDRKKKLQAAGYNYSTIQALVNKKLK